VNQVTSVISSPRMSRSKGTTFTEENFIVNPTAGLEGRNLTTSGIVLEPNPPGIDEDSTILEMVNYKEDSSILSVLYESLINFIPSYRDVLSRTLLSIYVGGKPVKKISEKIGKGEDDKGDPIHTCSGRICSVEGSGSRRIGERFLPS
jgi:hypothetical protein